MALDLVIDIGNSHIKGAIFQENALVSAFIHPSSSFSTKNFSISLQEKEIQNCLVASVNAAAEKEIIAALQALHIPFQMLDAKKLKIVLDVEEKEEVGADRIANCYGSLFHFPTNDCIIIDIGTSITFDFITKSGHYTGGAIYPGFDISAKALAEHTDRLPYVSIAKPASALGKTTETHIQSGIYYGLLGAVERIIAELKNTHPSPSSVKVLVTGGPTHPTNPLSQNLKEDLEEFIDLTDPYLTLVGLHEILKEHSKTGE